jgi:hypothetical protein
LFIRRVLRAILEETVSQSQVQIFFTELKQSEKAINEHPRVDFHGSTLSPIQIDDRGRIANWPEGFLDDDVRESQRMLDIMYGGGREDDDDDEL